MRALAGHAFVVVHAVGFLMLPVHVPVVQVVHVVVMDHRFMAAPGAMGVRVPFRRLMCCVRCHGHS